VTNTVQSYFNTERSNYRTLSGSAVRGALSHTKLVSNGNLQRIFPPAV